MTTMTLELGDHSFSFLPKGIVTGVGKAKTRASSRALAAKHLLSQLITRDCLSREHVRERWCQATTTTTATPIIITTTTITTTIILMLLLVGLDRHRVLQVDDYMRELRNAIKNNMSKITQVGGEGVVVAGQW